MNLSGLGLYWMAPGALIIGVENMEERNWKSGLHGRSQGEWVSDVSSDQEIIYREERKSGLSLPARGGRTGFRVFLCACYCCIDTGAL